MVWMHCLLFRFQRSYTNVFIVDLASIGLEPDTPSADLSIHRTLLLFKLCELRTVPVVGTNHLRVDPVLADPAPHHKARCIPTSNRV